MGRILNDIKEIWLIFLDVMKGTEIIHYRKVFWVLETQADMFRNEML